MVRQLVSLSLVNGINFGYKRTWMVAFCKTTIICSVVKYDAEKAIPRSTPLPTLGTVIKLKVILDTRIVLNERFLRTSYFEAIFSPCLLIERPHTQLRVRQRTSEFRI